MHQLLSWKLLRVKRKVSLCLTKYHAMRMYGAVELQLRVLNLDASWKCVVSFMHRQFYPPPPGKEPPVPNG
jgi:hypothetical protein